MPHQDAAYWIELHVRFLQGEADAWEEIAEFFLPWLSQRLSTRWVGLDDHLTVESAENALLDYRRDPLRFDATRATFLGYWLLIQARGHLSHLLRSKRRQEAKEKAIGGAYQFLERKLSEMGHERAITCREKEEEVEEQQQIVENLLRRLKLPDRVGVELLCRQSSFDEWVEHLEIANLPLAEQRRRVSAEKALLKKKLCRLARRLGLSQG